PPPPPPPPPPTPPPPPPHQSDDKTLKAITRMLNPFNSEFVMIGEYKPVEEYLEKIDSIEVRISNDCKKNICNTKAHNKETGKLVYETNCKDGKLHGKQYMSNMHNKDNHESIMLKDGKSEITLHYKDGKLHGKQRIEIPWYEAEFSVVNDKLHGEYKEQHYTYNAMGGYRMEFNMVNGVAIGDYSRSGGYNFAGGAFSEERQGQYDSSGNFSGVQVYRSNEFAMTTTHEITIISCENNECRVYATYTGQQSGEAFNRTNKVYEALGAKKRF
ncbi:hypothetical protein, partial [Helicobacter bilis]|uniref:hypothetical protein n=1 Tax=Helicobacter bilis TaxID=37372 RepID=UPI0026ED89D5